MLYFLKIVFTEHSIILMYLFLDLGQNCSTEKFTGYF